MATKKKQSLASVQRKIENKAMEVNNEREKSQESASVSPAQQLFNLLEKEPELRGKLFEALQSGRFFITVTFQKKYRPDDEHDLHHYWIRKNIMVNDVVPALKHVAADFIAKENPTAELPDKNGWH